MTYLGKQIDELSRAIKNQSLAEADDRNAPSEYGTKDSHLDKELGIRRDDGGIHYTRAKRGAVDNNGKPSNSPFA